MSAETNASSRARLPQFVLSPLRGVGQVFFQENALTGFIFLLAIAINSPLMAAGAAVGTVIGAITAAVLKFDDSETAAGIFGFNAVLVGIATLFFFQPGAISIGLLLAGCVVATLLTRLMRQTVPFPTYTTPFILTTWSIFILGKAIGVPFVDPSGPPESLHFHNALANGIGQVMFQGNPWTGVLFVVGIAVNHWQHAAIVLVASAVGAIVANYHISGPARALDVERLIERAHAEVIALGLYGFNATLAAIALSLAKKPYWISALLGALLTVPIAEFVPTLGLPALTAPFVLATWIVLGLGWLEKLMASEPDIS